MNKNFMFYDDLCRESAHNLAERGAIEDALKEHCSPQRLDYLRGRLRELHQERGRLMAKEKRIRKFKGSTWRVKEGRLFRGIDLNPAEFII